MQHFKSSDTYLVPVDKIATIKSVTCEKKLISFVNNEKRLMLFF